MHYCPICFVMCVLDLNGLVDDKVHVDLYHRCMLCYTSNSCTEHEREVQASRHMLHEQSVQYVLITIISCIITDVFCVKSTNAIL